MNSVMRTPPPVETPALGRLPGSLVHWSSKTSNWPNLFATFQTGSSFSGFLPASRDHLLVVTLNRPVHVIRRIAGEVQERFVPPGSASIIASGADCNINLGEGGDALDTIHLHIRHDLLEEIHGEMFGAGKSFTLHSCLGEMDPLIHAIATEIHAMLVAHETSDRLYVETLTRTLVSRLLRNYTAERRGVPHAPAEISSGQLSRAIEYIKAYLDHNISLSDIAAAAGASPSQLTRHFRAKTKLAPYEYVLHARVDRARQLLLTTNASLMDIALQCGFSHQQHMTRLVHRLTGRTPGAIRRRKEEN